MNGKSGTVAYVVGAFGLGLLAEGAGVVPVKFDVPLGDPGGAVGRLRCVLRPYVGEGAGGGVRLDVGVLIGSHKVGDVVGDVRQADGQRRREDLTRDVGGRCPSHLGVVGRSEAEAGRRERLGHGC